MGAIAGILLAGFLVVMVVILVLLSNPPNRWVEKFGRRDKDEH